MNYQAFKDYLADFLWREGDPKLIGRLDNLIKMGEATLRARLRVTKREQTIDATFANGVFAIPFSTRADIRSVVTHIGEHTYVNPQRMSAIAQTHEHTLEPVYTLNTSGDNTLVLLNFQGPSTVNGKIIVYVDIPDFQALNKSWLVEENLDLYTYAVLQHASAYLREDQRITLWKQQFADLIEHYADDQAIHGDMEGPSTTVPLPYPASPLRRR